MKSWHIIYVYIYIYIYYHILSKHISYQSIYHIIFNIISYRSYHISFHIISCIISYIISHIYHMLYHITYHISVSLCFVHGLWQYLFITTTLTQSPLQQPSQHSTNAIIRISDRRYSSTIDELARTEDGATRSDLV